MRIGLYAVILLVLMGMALPAVGSMEGDFKAPPPHSRPWVYWFWLNGNITREGITADLEAMARVGIGGVLIMEVDQGAPLGPIPFMSAEWRVLFKHVDSEAKRLGIEVNMNNDAGWNGSGGPWIKPEQSMQKVVWSETEVEGGKTFDGTLPQPKAIAGFYQDISVIAFPTPGAFRIPGIDHKAGAWGGPNSPGGGSASGDKLSDEMIIGQDRVIDLTKEMDASGNLVWDAPAGKWTVMRFGRTSTGAQNGPAHASGRGLDCDKLSKEGVEANFAGMMAKLAQDTGITPTPGSSMSMSTSMSRSGLVATHIDSWEVGSQNWTAEMREEFSRRRGYDPLPYLPVISGRVVGSMEISDRFLWDLRKTVSELVVENYAGRMHELANAAGMRFTCEAYGSPCDNLPYAGMSDEPMGEFWYPAGAMETCKGMASAGHVYGKPIIGAEAFTADSRERWEQFPGSIKALGDLAFCNGINRFVFHRYAMQPWEPMRMGGMTMGPWGLHYERSNTWWELTGPWHEYLARCQYMLRQGTFVADILYLQAEAPPQSFRGLDRKGYEWDECPAEALIDLASVKDGRIMFPGGMSYRVLALPDSKAMTPRVLRKVKELAEAGATVVGPMPERSPSLSGYPKCDEEVKQLAAFLVKADRPGKGRVVWGMSPEEYLKKTGVPQDFKAPAQVHYIHRAAGGTDIYFVSNQRPYATNATCTFRVKGKVPELWWPDSGRVERAAVCQEKDGLTSVLLPLDADGSVFVVFRKGPAKPAIASLTHEGELVLSASPAPPPLITIRRATYGVPGDPARTRDVADRVRRKIEAGEYSFRVSDMAAGDDPAFGIVKNLYIEYTCDGQDAIAGGQDPETVTLGAGPERQPVCELRDNGKALTLTAWFSGTFALTDSRGKTSVISAPVPVKPIEIKGPWDISFPPDLGAPGKITLDRLASWTDNPDPGVKYFSGTGTYRTTFDLPGDLLSGDRAFRLDLGVVRWIARVKLNGKDLGIIWKEPYIVDVGGVLKPGRNELEISVTNLWPNRMIGDEQLPEDSERNANGTLKSWPKWLQEGKPSPTGRITFTSWRLWNKAEKPTRSGLIGPVTLRVGYEAALP